MEHLYRAIKSAQDTDNVLMRLMKKGVTPTLSLSIDTLSHYNSRFTIEQDVPCRPQKQTYTDDFRGPDLPYRDVSMMFSYLCSPQYTFLIALTSGYHTITQSQPTQDCLGEVAHSRQLCDYQG